MAEAIDPTRAQFEAFKAEPRDTPIHMLNLVRFKPAATYPDGRAATGAEAYAEYGRRSAPIFQRVGGSIVWRATPEVMLIGPDEEWWDLAFVAAYPDARAFLAMVTDPVYQAEAVPHRQAGVADSRLVRTAPMTAGASFSS